MPHHPSVDARAGRVVASPDGHFLMHEDGSPFFWLADTAWQLFNRLDRDDSDRYLSDRAERGFTVIQAVATGRLFGDWMTSPNRYGDAPFPERDPDRPNPRYYDHVDWVIDRAVRSGLRIALLPAWSYFAVAGPPGTRLFDVESAERYGAWIGARYADAGVLWVLGGDIDPLWFAGGINADFFATRTLVPTIGPELHDYRPVYDAMARGIAAGEGRTPFLTYHPMGFSPSGTAHPRTSLYFADRDWLTMNMIQSGHGHGEADDRTGGVQAESTFSWCTGFNYVPIGEEYRSAPRRPVVDGESRYEGHPSGQEPWTPAEVRNGLYHALFAGAAGHTYGHVSIWDLYAHADADEVEPFFATMLGERPEWSEALDAPGADQLRHAKALMLSRPYFDRIPDDARVLGEPGRGLARISATRAVDSSFVMVYLPRGGSVTVDASISSRGRARSWWFDPRTGEASSIEGVMRGDQTFVAPDDDDWVLVIDDASRGYPPPGQALD